MNGFIKSLELHDVDDWSEELVLYDVSFMADGDNGWLNIVAFTLHDIATIEDLTTLLLDLLNTFLVLGDTILGVERSKESLGVERITHLNGFVSRDHSIHELVMDAFVQEDSSHGGASLASSTNTGEDTCLESKV